MRAAWSPPVWQRLALTGAVVIGWILCAVWGAWLRGAATGQPPLGYRQLLDLLYVPFTYLVPQTEYRFAHKLLWQEALARVLGAAVPLLGLFWLVRRRLLMALATMLGAGGARGYALVLGNAGSADALASASSLAGEPVLLCDPTIPDDEDRQALLGAAGVLTLGRAGSYPARAGSIAAWSAADAENLAQALALQTDPALAGHDVLFAVHSPDAQRALLAAPGLAQSGMARLRPVSLEANAVRRALAQADPVALAAGCGQGRVTLVLWGDGPSLDWAAEYALRQFWSIHLRAPRVVWAGPDRAGQASAALSALAHHAATVFEPGWQPELAADGDNTGATLHWVDFRDPDQTIRFAFELAGRLAQAGADPAPVQPVLRGGHGIAPLFGGGGLAFLPPVLPEADLTLDSLRTRALDETAARLHLAYVGQHGAGGSESAGNWQDLPEVYVAANRALADHIAVKRWDAAHGALQGDALVEALAEVEHRRWCAERLLAGWAPAIAPQPRDNARRLHPCLVPWAMLDEESREKDREQVREATGL